MRRVRRVTLAVALAGCGATPPGPLPKTPAPSGRFVAGPALRPTGELLAWLKSRGPGERLRLPVVVRFDAHRLALRDAFVGVGDDGPADERLHLTLDDSAMGIALLDRLRRACPAGPETCAVWLEGRWGAVLPAAPSDPGRWPFAVFAVAEPQPEPRVYVETP